MRRAPGRNRESQWFWAEVPLPYVNMNGDNFLALWSPTSRLLSVSSSPVLAAAGGGKDQDTWLTRDISGAPPRTPAASMGTPISYFQPALALKLIPKNTVHPVNVQVVDFKSGTGDHPNRWTARVEGDSTESAWLEYFIDHPAEPNPRASFDNRPWLKVRRML